MWVWGPAPWDSSSSKSGKSGSSSSWSDDGWSDDGWSDDGWSDDGHPEPEKIYSKGGYEGGWKADGWDDDGHYKADIDYVRSAVVKLIEDSERELIPKFLRLGFHDCVGGCDGCVDLTNPDNKGLLEPIDAIAELVDHFGASHSRADLWAMATLVSADMAVTHSRPVGLKFPMRYIGRKDCDGADHRGVGGPKVEMPSNHLTTHELYAYFDKYFGFDMDETITIMGVHSVGVLTRENSGFGNKGKEDGWVFEAESYVLDNRYYPMFDKKWELELVHNDGDIPDRYQWYHEEDGKEERPLMTNADMALVRDFSDHMHVDKDGNEGAVDCVFANEAEKEGESSEGYRIRGLQYNQPKKQVACPVATEAMDKILEYKMDNTKWLYDFEKVLEKMLKNGY